MKRLNTAVPKSVVSDNNPKMITSLALCASHDTGEITRFVDSHEFVLVNHYFVNTDPYIQKVSKMNLYDIELYQGLPIYRIKSLDGNKVMVYDEEYNKIIEHAPTGQVVTPDYMYNIKPFVERAKGNVLVIGMGAGYFSYMAHLMDDVDTVTILDRSEEFIPIFDFPRKVNFVRVLPPNASYDCVFFPTRLSVEDYVLRCADGWVGKNVFYFKEAEIIEELVAEASNDSLYSYLATFKHNGDFRSCVKSVMQSGYVDYLRRKSK